MNHDVLKTALVILVVVGVFVLAGVVAWQAGLGELLAQRERLQEFVLGLGAWGVVAIIVAEVAQVILAAVPGNIIGIVAGYLYGVVWGSLICLVGLVIGTGIAVWLARRLGRPLVERFAGQELIDRIDRYTRERGTLALFLIFLLPFLPDDVVCFIAGLTPLPLGEVLVLAFIGRAPGVIVSCWIGANSAALGWEGILAISVGAIVMAILFERYHERVEDIMFSLIDRLTGSARRESD